MKRKLFYLRFLLFIALAFGIVKNGFAQIFCSGSDTIAGIRYSITITLDDGFNIVEVSDASVTGYDSSLCGEREIISSVSVPIKYPIGKDEEGHTIYTTQNFSGRVTSIGSGAFSGCAGLTHITIPENINTIETGNKASFLNCTGLKSVKIMSSLYGMERFTYPDYYHYPMESCPFIGCSNLERAEFHCSCILPLLSHPGIAFNHLKEILIGQEVDTIGAYAFYNCCALERIFIPRNVKMIQGYAFCDNGALSRIDIEDITAWSSGLDFGLHHRKYGDGGIDGPIGFWFEDCFPGEKFGMDVNRVNGGDNPLIYGHYLYMNGQEVTDLVIPETVDSITSSAFMYCYSLKKLNTGNGVKGIGANAFSSCENLEELTIGENVEWIETRGYVFSFSPYEMIYRAFGGSPKLTKLTWNAINCRTFENYLNIDTENLNDVVIGKKVRVLPGGFVAGSKIQTITIPSSVELIRHSFIYCESLREVIWKAKNCVYSPPYYYNSGPFNDCTALNHIIIDEEVEAIGDLMFRIEDSSNNIDTVTCYATVPPTISRDCFTDKTYNNAVLCVPKGTEDAYRSAIGWKEFFNCVPIDVVPGDGDELKGDVDGDSKVNIDDVTALINYLLSGDATGINLDKADCDGDGRVNIDDVTTLINYLLSGSW